MKTKFSKYISLTLLIAGAALASVEIKSGATSDLVTIGATSKALRVTMYDDNGMSISPAETFRGSANILVRQTAATAAGVCVWAIHNSSAIKTVQVLRIKYHLSFDGTGAASLMRYEWVKGTAVTVFSGGAAVTPAFLKTGISSAVSTVRVLDTGLTTTGLVAGGAVDGANMARLTFSATQAGGIGVPQVLDFATVQGGPLELAQNEILCLRNGPANASVVGDTVLGSVQYLEKLN